MSNRVPHECSRAGGFLIKISTAKDLQRIEMPGVQTRLNTAQGTARSQFSGDWPRVRSAGERVYRLSELR